MKDTRKQELTLFNYGDDWRLKVNRFYGQPPVDSSEPWIDEFLILIEPKDANNSKAQGFRPEWVDTSVINNLIQLVASGEDGLDLTFDLQCVADPLAELLRHPLARLSE